MRVSLGICAYNEERNISKLVTSVLRESCLDEIIVVASGCTDSTVEELTRFEGDRRVRVIVEPRRTGKVRAFNAILSLYRGDVLVSLPADVLPEEGAISRLLAAFEDGVGVVGGLPIPANGEEGILDRVALLAWRYHNELMLRQARRGTLSHASGEMFAFRRGVVTRLPSDVVNDDAAIAIVALRGGYRIAVAPSARVRMMGARTARDFVTQRRRVVVGHLQLRGQHPSWNGPPSLALSKGPEDPVRALFSVLRESPRLIMALPVAVALDGLARALAWVDWHSERTHHVWQIATSTKSLP